MKTSRHEKLEAGFSMTELLVCLVILLPVMGAALSLFRIGANQHATEQSSIDAVQDARAGLEMMAAEIAQAGSHRDIVTTTSGMANAGSNPVQVPSAVAGGFAVGDWIDIGAPSETVQITAVGTSSITASFGNNYASGTPLCLFAKPFVRGVIPPSGMGVSTSQNVTTLRFFGDINGNLSSPAGDPNLYYVEYTYESANNRITRSSTPLTTTTKASAVALVRNVKPGSCQFTVTTNALGIITSVNIALTVQNTARTGSTLQEMQLSTRVLIPSAEAVSTLIREMQQFQAISNIPPTPSNVCTLAGISPCI